MSKINLWLGWHKKSIQVALRYNPSHLRLIVNMILSMFPIVIMVLFQYSLFWELYIFYQANLK